MNKFSEIETGPAPVAVFLPGWGFNGRVIQLAEHNGQWLYPLTALQPATLVDDLAACLETREIKRIHLAGWSMGAYLALDFAAAHPDKIASLTLLAARSTWPAAEIDAIRREFIASPARFLETFYRKCFMGYKDAHRRFLKLQDDHPVGMDKETLLAGLAYLQAFKARSRYPRATIIHGKRDLVAPIDQKLSLPDCREKMVKHGGHPIFLDQEFTYPIPPRKDIIRRKFSRAAATYDDHAQVQKKLAAKLIDLAPALPASPTILEIGCGTGNYTAALAGKYPDARITALDFSEAMLDQARKKLAKQQNIKFICRDGEEYLADDPAEITMLTSNATMQWFDDFTTAAANIAKILQPDGVFYASMFGPRTMEKIAQGLKEVLGHADIIPSANFLSQTQLQNILNTCFHSVKIEEIIITRHYNSLHELLRYIQKTGTSGGQQPPPFFSRRRLRQLDAWFADKFSGYAITNQIFLLTARQPLK